MKMGCKALALAIMALLPCSAFADEPGPANAPRARVVKRTVVRTTVRTPLLVPDCFETWNSKLLKCAPRVYVRNDDISTLNQLDALPTRVMRPYPYLFDW
jgi:hypothetical protein